MGASDRSSPSGAHRNSAVAKQYQGPDLLGPSPTDARSGELATPPPAVGIHARLGLTNLKISTTCA